MVQHLLRPLSNPGIFKILVYSEPEQYSEPCQTCNVFLLNPGDEVFYSEPFVTSDTFKTLAYSELKSYKTQNTVNL